MNETKLTTIAQIREFLAGTADVYWTPEDDDKARYAFIRNVLSRFDCPRLARPDKGLSPAPIWGTPAAIRGLNSPA